MGKRVKDKKKNMGNEQKTIWNMVDINSTISIIILNMSCLKIPIKRQRFSEWI